MSGFETVIKVHSLVPERVRINILEHMRSHLALRELDTDDVGDFEVLGISFSALSTEYRFRIGHRLVIPGSSSIIAGVSPVKDKIVFNWYEGVLQEIVTPDSQYPIFEFTARKTGTSEPNL